MRFLHSVRRRKGVAIIMTAIMLTFIVPLVGLAIDAGIMYAVRARLQGAADAAALASARTLNLGQTLAEQQAGAVDRAKRYFKANFPDGTFDTIKKDVKVEVREIALRREVEVIAEFEPPVYFMRYLGWGSAGKDLLVRVSGTATRRDVNLMLVVDRSRSLASAGACDEVEASSRTFVDLFANERDRIGLITYGISYRVDYAPTKFFKNAPTLDSVLSNIDPNGCNGGTGSAQGFWNGYVQLNNIGEPGAFNVIVFFTDGIPNTVTADFPVKMQVTPEENQTTRCYDWTRGLRQGDAGWDPSGQIYRGALFRNRGLHDFNAPVMPVADDPGAIERPNGFTGDPPAVSDDCWFRNNLNQYARDLPYIPDTDLYGNSIFGYKPVDVYGAGHPYAGKANITDSDNIDRAAVNALDNAAQRVRDRALNPNMPVTVYVIGLGGAGAAEHELLRRVANDPIAGNFDPTKPQGMYVYAPTAAQLQEAFARVASEVLRFSK